MDGEPERKGGPPPAQKVGGMRVVQKKDKEEKSGEGLAKTLRCFSFPGKSCLD